MSQEHVLPLEQLIPLIREVLSRGGEFELHPQGNSMRPTIREGRDTVMLTAITRSPKRGDLLLYRRAGGTFVLHRVVRKEKDGTLSMRGDNQYFTERGIRENQLIATVKRYFRDGKEIRTDSCCARLYRARRTFTYPFRRVAHALARRLKRLLRGEKNG